MDGKVPRCNLFSEENLVWHLEDLDLTQTQQLIFSSKPANSSNNRFADAVSTTYFEENGLVTEFPPKKQKMQQTGQIMYGCNGQSRGIVTFVIFSFCFALFFFIFFINIYLLQKMVFYV